MPNQPPLNPDAVLYAVAALHGDNCPDDPEPGQACDCDADHYERLAETAVSAYLAAALPDADELLLVTIKLPKNPEHDPRNKKTGACEVSQECTDLTGEHHTVAVRSQKQVEALRDQFGHITRVERVDMNREDLTAALPEVTSVEELGQLPVGSIIADLYDERGNAPVVLCKALNRDWAALTTGTQNGRPWWTSEEIAQVARRLRVLHRPEVKP